MALLYFTHRWLSLFSTSEKVLEASIETSQFLIVGKVAYVTFLKSVVQIALRKN